jgi:hypothetical protein
MTTSSGPGNDRRKHRGNTVSMQSSEHPRSAGRRLHRPKREGGDRQHPDKCDGGRYDRQRSFQEATDFRAVFACKHHHSPLAERSRRRLQSPKRPKHTGLELKGRLCGAKFSDCRGSSNEPARRRSAPGGSIEILNITLLVAWDPMTLPKPITTIVVLPFVRPAIGDCRGSINTVLAQHVAPVGYPRVERAEPVCQNR